MVAVSQVNTPIIITMVRDTSTNNIIPVNNISNLRDDIQLMATHNPHKWGPHQNASRSSLACYRMNIHELLYYNHTC